MKEKNVLVIGNVFESKSLIVSNFCECDNEVIAEKLSSRISGAAIVVSAIAAFLHMNATLVTKAKTSSDFNSLTSKLSMFGINTTQIDFSATESNTLITIYDSHQDRKCYSYLPAQIKMDDLVNIDYSLYDAVFFCCLPYIVVAPIFKLSTTIHQTQSIILASGLTPEYFYKQKLKIPANYIFCNRGELFSVLDEKKGYRNSPLDTEIAKISTKEATLVVTMGKDGVIIADENSIHRVSVPEIKKIVHPGGAGDAFATGFICGILEGMNIDQCCSLGHKCSAQMLSVYNVVEFIESALKE